MKRMTIVCLLLSLLFAGAVAGATQISFWHPWGPGTPTAIAVEQIAEAFEKTHSEIDVEVVACGGAGDEVNKFLVAVASGTPPDLAIMGGLNVEWIESGILQPLTVYFDRDGLGPENFYPGVYEAMQYDGELWTVPVELFLRTWQLVINKQIFSEAGLDPYVSPETVYDLEELDRKLTVKDANDRITRVGMYPFDSWGHWNAFSQWVYRFGGDFYDHSSNKLSIASEENVKALDWLNNWYQRVGHANYQTSTLAGAFNNSGYLFATEKVAMSLWVNGFAADVNEFAAGRPVEYRTAVLPYHPDIQKYDGIEVVCDWAFSIPSGATYPEEAWEFIKFWITSDEAANLLGETVGALTICRSNPYEEVLLQEPDLFGAFIEYLGHACAPKPPVAGLHNLGALINEVIPQVYREELTPSAALARIEKRVQIDVDELQQK